MNQQMTLDCWSAGILYQTGMRQHSWPRSPAAARLHSQMFMDCFKAGGDAAVWHALASNSKWVSIFLQIVNFLSLIIRCFLWSAVNKRDLQIIAFSFHFSQCPDNFGIGFKLPAAHKYLSSYYQHLLLISKKRANRTARSQCSFINARLSFTRSSERKLAGRVIGDGRFSHQWGALWQAGGGCWLCSNLLVDRRAYVLWRGFNASLKGALLKDLTLAPQTTNSLEVFIFFLMAVC